MGVDAWLESAEQASASRGAASGNALSENPNVWMPRPAHAFELCTELLQNQSNAILSCSSAFVSEAVASIVLD